MAENKALENVNLSEEQAFDPQNKIEEHWPLSVFRAMFAHWSYAKCANKTTGEILPSLAFSDSQGKITFAGFSKKLGNPSKELIKSQLNNLSIGKMANGRYLLYQNGGGAWEDMDA